MTASSYLSVELWQAILRYCIGVEDFLDPSAFDGIVLRHLITDKTTPKCNEVAYWSAERTRHQLLCVCTSWNAYLLQFEHRFVRMQDILHGKIRPETLKKAVRVSLSMYTCKCEEHCFSPRAFANFCYDTVREVGQLNVQMVDMGYGEYDISDFLGISSNIQHVRTFIALNCRAGRRYARLLQKLPNLHHVYCNGFRGSNEFVTKGVFESSGLTTLSFHLRGDGKYDNVSWSLPSLRHLRIRGDADYSASSEFINEAILEILTALGNQLLSLCLYLRPRQSEMLRTIWILCPQLTLLRASVPMDSPPPFFHPLHTLVVPSAADLVDFLPLPDWTNLRRIIIDQGTSRLAGMRIHSSITERLDIRVEDRCGHKLDIFVPRLSLDSLRM